MFKKKRILLVTHDFTVTGAPLSLLNVAKILQKDYDISVWGLSGGALFSRYGKDLDIEPIILSNKYKKHPSLLLPKLNKFDFVILNTVVNKKLASVCQNNGIPYIWTIREGQNLVCWHNKKLSKIIKQCQNNIYVVSEYAKEYVDKTYDVNVKVIHNLVPDEYLEIKKQKSDKLSFTFLGSIHSRKGVDLIVESFLQQNNTNWELNICGEGKLEPQLKEISKNCPNIKWQGVVTGDTRRKIFENTDIFLVPSLDEACSRVVLEAMMMACPVIISQNVGAKYMVNDNTGWIVKTGDVESLKICIENILKNPEKIQTMKKYARQMYLSTSTEEIYRKNIYSIIEKNLKQPVISKLKRMLFSKSYLFIDKLFDLSRLLFSVTNQTEGSKCRKVITFLGFKLKIRNKKKEQELKLIKLEQKVNNLVAKNEELRLLIESVRKQLKSEYDKKNNEQNSIFNTKINNLARSLQYKIHKYCPDEKRAEALKDWYYDCTGEFLDLENPQTFNEKIQWLKLYDSTPLKAKLANKYLVREWIKEKIGEKYLIPLLGVWDKFDDIDFDELPQQFVLKCNHGSGYNIIVKDKSKLNIEATRKQINNWMNEDFSFKAGFEMHYSAIPRKIIAEKYIEPEVSDIELQGWCFKNKLKFISYENCKDTEKPARCIVNRNWEVETFQVSPQHFRQFDEIPQKPEYLDEFLNICDYIAKDFEHVRIDFIVVHNKLYFRELTFTSGSGLSKFEPKDVSLQLGREINLNKKEEGIVLCK